MEMFTLEKISLSNFAIDGFNPVSFSLLGMMIVFVGLMIISLYIVLLPKILALPQLITKKQKQMIVDDQIKSNDCKVDRNTLLAIAVAFHIDQDFPEDDQKLTWISHGDLDSSWMSTGIAHGLSVRNHVHISRRRH